MTENTQMEKEGNNTEGPRPHKDTWMEKAWHGVDTPDVLRSFALELASQTESAKGRDDASGIAADAASALAVASACMFAKMFSMTAYQKSRVMWNIVDALTDAEHDCGLKMVNYNHMLYPQYEDEFSGILPRQVWEALRTKAAETLSAKGDGELCEEVRSHLQSIADGKVPFGHSVRG